MPLFTPDIQQTLGRERGLPGDLVASLKVTKRAAEAARTCKGHPRASVGWTWGLTEQEWHSLLTAEHRTAVHKEKD